MAEWKNPKTDWVTNPKNPVAEDFNRIEGNIDFLKSDIETKKGAIVNALNTVGLETELTDTHAQIANKIVAADQGTKIYTPGTANITIPKGFHSGQGYVVGDPNLKATNITEGVSIFGVAGSMPRVIEISDKMAILDLIDYGGNINALAFDGTYLYVGGNGGRVWKINPSNMSKVAESAAHGATIYALAFDGTYLYAGGSARTVWKINPSDMSKVAESDNYGSEIRALAFDGTYLYAGGGARTVWKINPSDMSKVAESANYGGYIRALAFDGTYLYVGGNGGRVWKINPSNMSKVAESVAHGAAIYALAFDGTYLYAGGDAGSVWQMLCAVYKKEV